MPNDPTKSPNFISGDRKPQLGIGRQHKDVMLPVELPVTTDSERKKNPKD